MSAKPWVVVAVMAMMCLMPYQSVDFGYLSDDAESKEGPGQGQGPADILLMGNSYVASNSLHNLVEGVMSAASQPDNVSALTSGGMRLSQHASNVASAPPMEYNTQQWRMGLGCSTRPKPDSRIR